MTHEERRLKACMERIEAPLLTAVQRRSLDSQIAREAEKIVWVPGKNLAQRVWEQAAYISPFTWIFQVVFLAFGLYLLNAGLGMSAVKSLSVLIPLAGMIAVPEMTKSFSYGMWELEESCFYNMRQVIFLKMVILGIADGILILAFIAAAGSKGIRLTEAFYYMAVPFNLSNACYLFLFKLFKRRCSGYMVAAAGCLIIAAGWLAERYRILDISRLMERTGPGAVWIAVAASAAVLAAAGLCLLSGLKKEEEMIWSFE